jgi:hypothetical protein
MSNWSSNKVFKLVEGGEKLNLWGDDSENLNEPEFDVPGIDRRFTMRDLDYSPINQFAKHGMLAKFNEAYEADSTSIASEGTTLRELVNKQLDYEQRGDPIGLHPRFRKWLDMNEERLEYENKKKENK